MHLIGIELLDGKDSVIKNLKDKWYPFVFCEQLKEPPTIDTELDFETFDNFYTYNMNSIPKVSISCIVGENGSGKSTLLDILFRIINNFSYCLDKKLCNVDYAKGFHAKLYYSKKCEIEVEGKTVIKEKIGFVESNAMNEEIDLKIQWPNSTSPVQIKQMDSISVSELENFFYTIVTNYSIYSFNPDDYIIDNKEQNFYIKEIFQKNDAYVTPIVILPYRNENGIIEIDNERHLAVQRIIAMSIYFYKRFNTLLVENQKPSSVKYEVIQNYKNDKLKKEYLLNNIDQINFLEQIWKEYLIIKYNIIDTINGNTEIYNLSLFYLAYKTKKILDNYGFLYEAGISKEKNTDEIINLLQQNKKDKWNDKIIQSYSEFFIETIINDTSFMTLKLRQTLYFVEHPFVNLEKGELIINDEFDNTLKIIDDTFLRLPPPFYSFDLYFSDNVSNKTAIDSDGYSLSKLSSGQKQILYNLSYVLYHIKNLDTKDDKCTQQNINAYPVYENVLMIFDEAELYLHPELQRNFIYTLLYTINICNFSKIKNIHIIFATHSPYLLSDVIKNNVLILENGKRKNETFEQTLGANIYSLLNNQFFLKGVTGSYSQSIMNDLITKANKENNLILTKNEYNTFDLFIKHIGDPFLHDSLTYLLNKFEVKKD